MPISSRRARNAPGNFEGTQADRGVGGSTPLCAATEVVVYWKDPADEVRVGSHSRAWLPGSVAGALEGDLAA